MRGTIGERGLRAVVVTGLLCTFTAVCSGGESILSHSEYQLKKLMEKEDAKRSSRMAEVDKTFAQGRELWKERKYPEARAKMEQALTALARVQGNAARNRYADLVSEFNRMGQIWGRELFEACRKKYSEGDYKGALADTSAALSAHASALNYAYVMRNGAKELVIPGDLYADWVAVDKKFAELVGELTRKSQLRNQSIAKSQESALASFDSDLSENQKKTERLLREAQTYFRQKQYMQAADALEKIYLIDPFNVSATSMLKKVYNKLYTYGVARKEADMQGVLTAHAWRWVAPVSSESIASDSVEAESKTPSYDMFAKLDRIILPTLELEDSDINSVIGHLNQRSRTYDAQHEGVNFSISMTDAERDALRPVNVRFSNIPLSEALRYICQDLGLKYRVDNDGVTIGMNVDNMQARNFPVRRELINRIAAEASGSASAEAAGEEGMEGAPGGEAEAAPAAGGGGEGGGEGGESTLGVMNEGKDYTGEALSASAPGLRANNVTPEKLMAAFRGWGITFDRGCSVSYDGRNNLLRVTNTVENLRRLGKLLRQMDAVQTPLVLVEVKLLEITEKDLQELGFEWAFSMNNVKAGDTDTSNNWNAATTNPLRNSNNMLGLEDSAGNITLVKDLKLLPNFGNGLISGVNMDLSLTINAVSQNSRSETLSAPKLITSNGEEASIKLTRSYFFPDDWEEPEIETDGDFVTVTAPIPEWADEGTDVGIMLKVRPQVDPNNSDITLELHPEVVTYIGQTDDTVKLARGYINYQDNMPQYTETWAQVYKVWMPILGRRKLDATVKVKDGETIVLGGMVDNKAESVYDRWPVLGDIPLIGRLFSSQYEKRENASLLVFVTARLVNNSGLPFEQNVAPDMPDFRR